MGDSPPKYGFMPHIYQPEEVPQNHTSNANIYSGVALSYGMPIPYQELLHSPTAPDSSPHANPYSNLRSEIESLELLDTSAINLDGNGFAWQFIGPETAFPYSAAVRAGRDADGSAIFAGRAFHEGDMIPAKVHPDRKVAYICYQGEEIPKYEYEILRSGDFVWEFACNGEIPVGAVTCGKTAEGEDLYMARSLYKGTQTPGKLHPSHGCLYIPFQGEEIAIQEYEVLVLR